MRILIIGYSKIVQSRVLPALLKMPDVISIDIASQSSLVTASAAKKQFRNIFHNYETAMKESKADLVYISIVNNLHAMWTEKALKAGYHVIVDKPAFTNIEDAIRLVDLSQKLNLCLAEACVYGYHPQIEFIRNTMTTLNSRPTCLIGNFSFPPFPLHNFRYQKELGGGALWDLGAYAVTPGRIFFNEKPVEIFCKIGSRHMETDVDTSFSMFAFYPDGKSMVGHFGFTTEYRNRLSLLGPDIAIDIERIFTTPADMENTITIRRNNEQTIKKAPAGDSFFYFIQDVKESIENNHFNRLLENLIADAECLFKMRTSAGE
jgi:dTDP-3,4-didehydro-2,6-dideoxy-alpha-D-glucose 3-reductase